MEEIKLLLVDDEEEFRLATGRALARRGFQVSEADSGERALESIRASRPDVVVLDLCMDGMDGIETLTELRKESPDLPVIILTGHGGLDDAVAGIKLAVVDFLQKPVAVERLASHVRRLLSGRRGPLRERTIEELMLPASSFRRIYDDQPVRELLHEMGDSLHLHLAGKLSERGHLSVIVFDRQERFAGCVYINDLLDLLIPSALKSSPYSSYFTGMFLAQCKLVGNHLVGDLHYQVHAIDLQAPLMEAVHLMVSQRLFDLPVLQEGRLVGMLRNRELLLEITDAVL